MLGVTCSYVKKCAGRILQLVQYGLFKGDRMTCNFQVNSLGLAGLAGVTGGGGGAEAVVSRAAAWGTFASRALSRLPPSEPNLLLAAERHMVFQ